MRHLFVNRFRGNIGWSWSPGFRMGPRRDQRDWEHCSSFHATLHRFPRERAVIDELERVRHLARRIYLHFYGPRFVYRKDVR